MPDANKSPKIDTSIIVALIGAAATITVAVIALVPYFFPRNAPAAPIAAPDKTSAVAAQTRTPSQNPVTLPADPAIVNQIAPTAAPGSGNCFDQLLSGVVPEIVPIGKNFLDVPYPSNTTPAPLVLIVTERGVVLGGVHVLVDTTAKLTYVENVYDASCTPIETFANRDNPQGDKRILDDNYTLSVTFSDNPYELTFQIKPDSLRVNHPRRVE